MRNFGLQGSRNRKDLEAWVDDSEAVVAESDPWLYW